MRVQLVPRHGNRIKVQVLEQSLIASCPLPISVVTAPRNEPGVLLVLYGAGSTERTAMMNNHIAAGGNVVCFDRGYFGRSPLPEEEHYRIAINRLHVSPEHIEGTPDQGDRLKRFDIQLKNEFLSNGHVIVVGLGKKSRAGLGLMHWERDTLIAAQKRFPKRRILYRPKEYVTGHRAGLVRWRFVDGKSPIEKLLTGSSLVIARHSNVAVDACIAGIPVECEDGAARWLYASGPVQSAERRISFLRKLSWWNWRVNEMAQAWKFFLPRLA